MEEILKFAIPRGAGPTPPTMLLNVVLTDLMPILGNRVIALLNSPKVILDRYSVRDMMFAAGKFTVI